jgi:hypothetical protein
MNRRRVRNHRLRKRIAAGLSPVPMSRHEVTKMGGKARQAQRAAQREQQARAAAAQPPTDAQDFT